MAKFNKFGRVYKILQLRHPNWSKKKLRICTIYAIKKGK